MRLGRTIAASWGVIGTVGLLSFAIYRLYPFALDLIQEQLRWWHVAVLVGWVGFMIYVEGYRAFGQQFSPRVVARAQYLYRHSPTWQRGLAAPLFCIGYFGATTKRVITAYSLAAGIIALIVIVHFVPQPWRGIIDLGVVLGLAYGIGSLVYYSAKAIAQKTTYVTDPEVK